MGYTCPEHVFLHADHISKIYPGSKALDDVSFDLLKGKVNVLIGENGAGKSTLMKMIAGIEHPAREKCISVIRKFLLRIRRKQESMELVLFIRNGVFFRT